MSKELTAVSLFTGAGGMDVGFERAGIKVVFANELMKEAAQTYNANHPAGVMVNDDVNNVMDQLSPFEGVDLVFGGPPCQGFSVAGKMDPDDDRSKLIFTFLDVVERVKPRAFVMENVKALGILEKWEPVRRKYLERATALGYNCTPFILNATEFNVSQKRERVFFIGIRGNGDPFFEYNMSNLLEDQKKKAPIVRDLLASLGRAGTDMNPNTCTAKITFATHPIMRKSPYAGMYFNGQGRPINIDDYANTLPASMGGNKTPFVDEEYLYGDASEDWVVAYHKGLMDGTIVPEFEEAPSRLRTSVWNGIKSAITTPIEAAKNMVKSALDRISGFFSGLKLQLPHIKLPHFSISGSLSIAPPSVPHLSISWYKNGGILTSPTIFGMNGSSLMAGGEAGAEAVLPLKAFYDQLENILVNRLDNTKMEKYLSVIAANSSKGIYLEDGTLVGHLLPAIDSQLGQAQKLNRRLAL